MFKASLLVSFLFLSTAFAVSKPVYKLNVDLTLNGKPVASQGFLAIDGKKSEIQQKNSDGSGTFIEVTAEEIDGELNRVHMKFTVGTLVKGQRRILSAPEMIVTEGKSASIAVGDEEDSEHLTLTVLANRQVTTKK